MCIRDSPRYERGMNTAGKVVQRLGLGTIAANEGMAAAVKPNERAENRKGARDKWRTMDLPGRSEDDRKSGGRVKRAEGGAVMKMDAGAGGAEGRLEKMRKYGK